MLFKTSELLNRGNSTSLLINRLYEHIQLPGQDLSSQSDTVNDEQPNQHNTNQQHLSLDQHFYQTTQTHESIENFRNEEPWVN